MLARITASAAVADEERLSRATHVLVVLPERASLPAQAPWAEVLEKTLARRRMKFADLARDPVTANCGARLVVWVMPGEAQTAFERSTLLRRAAQILLEEAPRRVDLVLWGKEDERARHAEAAVYALLVNGAALPDRKNDKETRRPLERLAVHGHGGLDRYRRVVAVAEGNTLARTLALLPPNELTPALYRRRLRALARQQGWRYTEYDFSELERMGAGAFCAVAQGSDALDAAIVRLDYRPRHARGYVALVGKGICFDTGGHNLKPARHMHGMHKDMNGSAVAVGILLAATELSVPVRLSVWLPLAQNHISPRAYKQNDVVRALNGTTIEIVHTDAEGRMVLADTLTLAAREEPDCLVDFATLTGSMKVALGNRYSGVLSNSTALLDAAIAAGQATGERVCAFPIDADYEEGLKSKIADIKQCSMEGDADHILAARFLMRFVEGRPWLHMDLSADDCEGGLGAVASEVTGFGVAWGLDFLERIRGSLRRS